MMTRRLTARIVVPEAMRADEIAAWEDLCEGVPRLHSAFYSHAFALAAAKAGYRVRVAIVEDAGGIIGFFPFQFRHRLAESLGMAERVGEEMSDYFGLVAEPSVRITPAQLLAACRLNCCGFTHLDAWQAEMGLEGEQPEPSPRIELPPDIETYWQDIKKRDKKFIADTTRCGKKIEKDIGKLHFEFQSGNRMPDFETLMDLKRKQYLATTQSDLFSARNREKLLRNLLHADAKGCTGVLSVIRAGTEVAALHFGLQCHDVLHYWFPVYNPALKAYAPGRLLLSRLADVAHEHGIRVIDLGAGDSEAKRKLANGEVSVFRGLWSRNATARLIGRALASFQWRLGIPFM
jgi:CelD/BcsL family acetyltransferase involved in cellulose biosynthesis